MLKRNVILLAILTATAIWRWSPVIASADILPDEQVYLRAARHVAAGDSPYREPGYLYPPPLAHLLATLSPPLGEAAALRVLRMLAMAGVVLTVWLSARLVRWPLWAAATAATSFTAFAPAIDIATTLGNAAGIATALVLGGLLAWQALPTTAGVMLAAGLVFKPIAPLSPLLLLVHRSRPAGRSQLTTVLAFAAATVLLSLPYLDQLPGLLANARGHTNPYNFSLHKLLTDLGLELHPLVVLAAVGALAIAVLRRMTVSRESLLTIVIAASLLALPILWAHSLLLFLPVQIFALDRCGRALAHRSSSPASSPALAALALVAVASTLLAHAVGTTYGLPSWAEIVARAVPLAAIPFLTWFVVSDREPGPRHASRHSAA